MAKHNKIEFSGEIDLGGYPIPCYVLENGTRIISGFAMQNALKITDGGSQSGGNRVGELLSSKTLEPFINKEKSLTDFEPIVCYKGDFKINGYEASTLADICEIMLEARRDPNTKLQARQMRVAEQCEILMGGFARVGIAALVDEATGYQYERERFELQKILTSYVSEKILEWQLTFTTDFYQQLFRLWNYPFNPKSIKKKPQFVGTLTIKYIYSQLPDVVLDEIKKTAIQLPNGRYRYRWHQALTLDIGREHLKKTIAEVTALMKISNTKEEFQKFYDKQYYDYEQLEFEFDDIKVSSQNSSKNEKNDDPNQLSLFENFDDIN